MGHRTVAANWWAANQALLSLCAAGSAGAAYDRRAWHWLRLAMANANHILLSFPFFGNLRSHSSARGLFIFGQQIRQLISIVVAIRTHIHTALLRTGFCCIYAYILNAVACMSA